MRDAEEAIEKVITCLREADVPVGMEMRILRAMENRVEQGKQDRFWSRMTRPAFAFAGAAGIVLLAVLALPWLWRPDGSVSSQGVAAVNSADEADRRYGVPQRLKPLGGEGRYGTAKAVPLSKAGLSANKGESLSGDKKFQLGDPYEVLPVDQEALALSEMLAPSKPAPPLPLTPQEKLLAQVARKGEPEELATLRPDVREKQMEISKAEYQNFFEPSLVKDNE